MMWNEVKDYSVAWDSRFRGTIELFIGENNDAVIFNSLDRETFLTTFEVLKLLGDKKVWYWDEKDHVILKASTCKPKDIEPNDRELKDRDVSLRFVCQTK